MLLRSETIHNRQPHSHNEVNTTSQKQIMGPEKLPNWRESWNNWQLMWKSWRSAVYLHARLPSNNATIHVVILSLSVPPLILKGELRNKSKHSVTGAVIRSRQRLRFVRKFTLVRRQGAVRTLRTSFLSCFFETQCNGTLTIHNYKVKTVLLE